MFLISFKQPFVLILLISCFLYTFKKYACKNRMIKLSSYLLRSKTLISLDLTNNQISGEGGFALSLVIKENTGLKILKLAMNRFDDQNASLILKALTKNTFLEELDLSSNELGVLVIEILSIFFQIN